MILLFTAAFTILALSSLDQGQRVRFTTGHGDQKKVLQHMQKLVQEIHLRQEGVGHPLHFFLNRSSEVMAPIDTVYGTLDLVDAKLTKQYSEKSELMEEIEGDGTYTMFAPSDDAWETLDPVLKAPLLGNGAIELYNTLHHHMVNKRLLTKDLKNDMTIESMYNNQGLLINHYSNGVVTVNCARIIHGNQVATNGVVHVIDRVISSVEQSIKDVIEKNDELTSLNTASMTSGLLDQLGESGHYTLFAPTNKAFEKLDREVLERLLGDKSLLQGSSRDVCVEFTRKQKSGLVALDVSQTDALAVIGQWKTFKNTVTKQFISQSAANSFFTFCLFLQVLLKYHTVNSVQCSEAIMAGSIYETLEGSNIEIGCDGESLTVNGIKMVLKKDIVTRNGVIHLIDQVLIPDSAKQVIELIGTSQSLFKDMVSELGLFAAMQPKTEYTVLAPLNGAFTEEVISMDERLFKIILENHILKFKISLSELYNGQLLETIGGKLLRVFIYRTAVCIENACMVRGSKEGSNGALYIMRSLIHPAQTTIYDLLLKDGRFKIFLTLMESAKLTDLLKQEGSYTVFAPIDDAFRGLSEADLNLLKSDINTLTTILLYHFSKGIFINGGLEAGVTNLLKTMQGNNLQVLSINNSIHVNSVDVPDFDLMASNGVVHVVKTILYPKGPEIKLIEKEPSVTKVTRVIENKPGGAKVQIEGETTKVTRVIEGQLPVTTVTRVIESGPVAEHIVIEGEPSITKVTRVVEGEPSITKVTRVVEGEPSITKVTRVIGGEPSITKVTRVVEGEPSITKVRRVVGGEPSITKVRRVVGGEPSITKVTRVVEGEPSITKVTRVVEGEPSITKVTRVVEGEPSITKVTRVVEGEPSITKVTRVVEGEPSITKVTRVVEGEPSITKVTRVVEGEPSITKVTRVVEGEPVSPKLHEWLKENPVSLKLHEWLKENPVSLKLHEWLKENPVSLKLHEWLKENPVSLKLHEWLKENPVSLKLRG
ncbi:Periostin [Triplophysa tibetana]|uniref:Periostin n=1 Tax=Triplophysa tibetana TaxID=1572043 RepID=A0A5A9N4Y1_9TELE|nr:Periostin [Triplophysa tibetana]